MKNLMALYQRFCSLTLACMVWLLAGNPARAETYDLATQFSTVNNPNGVWSYGYETSLGGAFVAYPTNLSVRTDNGVSVTYWALSASSSGIYHNATTNGTALANFGSSAFTPGQVWVTPGTQESVHVVHQDAAPVGGHGLTPHAIEW